MYTSGSESDGGSMVRKGILKNTGHSSGSEQDARSIALSSGDEHSEVVVDGPKSNTKKKSSPRRSADEFEGSEHNSRCGGGDEQGSSYKAAMSSPKSLRSPTHSISEDKIAKSAAKSHPEENETVVAEDSTFYSDHKNQDGDSEICDHDF